MISIRIISTFEKSVPQTDDLEVGRVNDVRNRADPTVPSMMEALIDKNFFSFSSYSIPFSLGMKKGGLDPTTSLDTPQHLTIQFLHNKYCTDLNGNHFSL